MSIQKIYQSQVVTEQECKNCSQLRVESQQLKEKMEAQMAELERQNLDLQKEIARLSLDLGNLGIRHDLQVTHYQTKINLLEDALKDKDDIDQ